MMQWCIGNNTIREGLGAFVGLESEDELNFLLTGSLLGGFCLLPCFPCWMRPREYVFSGPWAPRCSKWGLRAQYGHSSSR